VNTSPARSWKPGYVALDHRLAEPVRRWIESLTEDEREIVGLLIAQLERDPEPDGRAKVEVPPHFPYPPGVIIATLGGYRIRYRFESPTNHAVIHIAHIARQ
jgi:hypothetical protein